MDKLYLIFCFAAYIQKEPFYLHIDVFNLVYHEVPGHDVAESSNSNIPEEMDGKADHPHVLKIWKQQFVDALSVMSFMLLFESIIFCCLPRNYEA